MVSFLSIRRCCTSLLPPEPIKRAIRPRAGIPLVMEEAETHGLHTRGIAYISKKPNAPSIAEERRTGHSYGPTSQLPG